jgi:hypothetical protein
VVRQPVPGAARLRLSQEIKTSRTKRELGRSAVMKAASVWKTTLVVAEPLLPTTVVDRTGMAGPARSSAKFLEMAASN